MPQQAPIELVAYRNRARAAPDEGTKRMVGRIGDEHVVKRSAVPREGLGRQARELALPEEQLGEGFIVAGDAIIVALRRGSGARGQDEVTAPQARDEAEGELARQEDQSTRIGSTASRSF